MRYALHYTDLLIRIEGFFFNIWILHNGFIVFICEAKFPLDLLIAFPVSSEMTTLICIQVPRISLFQIVNTGIIKGL